ncbi:MAG TPA: N-acetylmuramoyl-L-alanine amidase [Phycisphaerae bacterium]|jgi:N-acetylmuramoyl-L-alanine amidase|nr:N-acetylmuramoyl-L-alanine amidase [Phycisphaerae bacterium]HRS29488.1 N-acetylmuramoyl-L-alanine amidase [Phycisphaerae bacterium]HRT42698.1 N-acetylmuramoyl-L-alanine amidase [Phycisphaerae bacterium]
MREIVWLMSLIGLSWQIACKAPQPVAPPVAPREPLAELCPPAIDPMLAVNTLKPAPLGFLECRLASPEYAVPPYAKFLAGVRICLDPGHGGDAHKRGYKRGPTGVREAEVDLRVAQYLRELLLRAGAEVRLTREGDCDVGLSERAAIANEWPADLFISLHHNANDDPQVNCTTVWYHAGVDHRPASLDLARYLCFSLQDGLAHPQIADVPLRSDQLMYDIGFAVLRETNMPGALTESSYHTNPAEEQRLRDPEYNLREAWALFLGLAKYAAAGLPRARLLEPANGILLLPAASTTDLAEQTAPPQIVFELDDGLRSRRDRGWERQMILTDSIIVRLDGQPVPHTFSNEGYRLCVELPRDLPPGEHEIRVDFQNMNKNSVLNPLFRLVVVSAPGD